MSEDIFKDGQWNTYTNDSVDFSSSAEIPTNVIVVTTDPHDAKLTSFSTSDLPISKLKTAQK